jgi:hypothetical protein
MFALGMWRHSREGKVSGSQLHNPASRWPVEVVKPQNWIVWLQN